MSVDKSKKEYDAYSSVWQKCRAAIGGQEDIHNYGETYLPKLTGQSKKEYDAYRDRALFYNATQRTVDAMSGLLFRKDAKIDVPDQMRDWLLNIDFQGNSTNVFVEDIADEVLSVGRIGLLVDYPTTEIQEGLERTRAEIEQENLRPFVVKYHCENIINWHKRVINNISVLDFVVLEEVVEVLDTQNHSMSTDTKYRVLLLDEENVYRQQIYYSDDNKDLVLEQEFIPSINGETLDFIPFIFINPKDQDCEIKKPPLLDLVNVNLSHYKSTADIEHAAHYTALPTAVVTGHNIPEGASLKIGSSEAWVFSEPEAKAFYLEYSGSGLDALEKRLEKKENQMAALGARMLVNEKAAAETAESHQIKRQGEYSALATIAESISNGMTEVLKTMAYWENISEEGIEFEINKDFFPKSLGPQELTALLQTWQSGGIAFSDFIAKLQEGEIVANDRTPENIKEDLELEGIVDGSNINPEE